MSAAVLPWHQKPMARAMLSGGRRRIAMKRLLKKPPHSFSAPLVGGRMTVLVHPSTKKRGYWQATFFDADGPFGDSESSTWAALLEHIHGDSVDWAKAQAR